jgi:hypothetical protein
MDDAAKRVGSTFRWLETYSRGRSEGLQNLAFALIVLVLATGAAVLVTVGHEVHVAAAQRLAELG